jgi:hypothetical protein
VNSNDINKSILVLWCVPRSSSTAFAKAFQQRGDMALLHEPFSDCYYFSDQSRSNRYGAYTGLEEHNGRFVENDILSHPGRALFVKELAFQAAPYISQDFFGRVSHSFLIRRPEQVYHSLIKIKPDFTEEEFGFTALADMFERVKEFVPEIPYVIAAEDFCARPKITLREFCDHYGLAFFATMLRWKPGPIREWMPHEVQSQAQWHKTLEQSTGILAQTQHVAPVRPEHRDMIDTAQRIYERLLLEGRPRPESLMDAYQPAAQ